MILKTSLPLLPAQTRMIDFFKYFISYISLTSIWNSKDMLHKICIGFFSDDTHSELTQALLCGKKLPKNDTRLLLSQAGMMHLLVVSGYHLGLFQKLWSFSFKKIWASTQIELLVLALYALMTDWQPPVVRALIERALKIKAHEHQAILLSFIITILLHPTWASSLSLHLSLIARGAVYLSNKRSVFTLTGIVTASLSPLMLMHNPITSFFSLLVSPFFLLSILVHSLVITAKKVLPIATLNQNILNLSSSLVDTNLNILVVITKFFSRVDPITFIKHPHLRLLYVIGYLVFVYQLGICRYRNTLVNPESIKTKPSSFGWALFIFFILTFQPRTLI